MTTCEMIGMPCSVGRSPVAVGIIFFRAKELYSCSSIMFTESLNFYNLYSCETHIEAP